SGNKVRGRRRCGRQTGGRIDRRGGLGGEERGEREEASQKNGDANHAKGGSRRSVGGCAHGGNRVRGGGGQIFKMGICTWSSRWISLPRSPRRSWQRVMRQLGIASSRRPSQFRVLA